MASDALGREQTTRLRIVRRGRQENDKDGRRKRLRIGLGLGLGQRRTLTTDEKKGSDGLESDSMWGGNKSDSSNYEYRRLL